MKKYIPVILIGCVLLTVLITPIFTHAQTGTSTSTSTPPVSTNPPSSLGKIGDTELSIIGRSIKWLMYLGLVIEGFFIMLAGMLVGVGLQFNMSILNFDPPFITIGWQIFRDIANLGFVVGIVIIAISTILRIEGYQAKQILWKLIIAALVVNFSLLMGGIIIQPANSISRFLMNYIGSGDYASAAKIGDAMRFIDLINSGGFASTATGELVGWLTGGIIGSSPTFFMLATMAVLLVFGFVMFLTLISFAGMLFVRYFHLAFLLIISPVVWLLWIFPKTQKYFKEWWEKFIHWTIFAPLMMLFLYIALLVLDKYPRNVSNLALGIPGSGGLGIDFGLLATGLFAAAILIGGLRMAAKMGHGGTALALGAVDKGQKWAKNYVKTKSERAGARVGSSVMQKTTAPLRGKMEKWAEKSEFGALVSRVTAPVQRASIKAEEKLEKKKQEYVDERKKKYANYSPDRLNQMLRVSTGEEQAAITQLLAEKDKLGSHTQTAGGIEMIENTYNKFKKLGKEKEADDFLKKVGLDKDALDKLKVFRANPKNKAAQDAFVKATNKTIQTLNDDEYKSYAKNIGINIAKGKFFGIDSKVVKNTVGKSIIKEDAIHNPSKVRVLSANIKDPNDLKQLNTNMIDGKLSWMGQYIRDFEQSKNDFVSSIVGVPTQDQQKRIDRMETDLSKMQSEYQKFRGEFLNKVLSDQDYAQLIKKMGGSNTSTIQEMRDFARSLKVV